MNDEFAGRPVIAEGFALGVSGAWYEECVDGAIADTEKFPLLICVELVDWCLERVESDINLLEHCANLFIGIKYD